MFDRLRSRLTYANVVSTLCLFLLLGGGAYAASELAKNSVGSKQIKNKSVKSKDLAKKSVKTKNLKGNAVNGAKVQNDSLKGDDIDESTLSVADADRVGGSQVDQISYTAGPNTGPVQLFSAAGLTVTAACPAATDDFVNLTAATNTNNSIISLPNQVVPAGTVGTQPDFDAGAPITVPIDDTTTTMAYGRGPTATPVVTASFLANQRSAGGTDGTCKVVGTVVTDG
jgi:hypothetical protein